MRYNKGINPYGIRHMTMPISATKRHKNLESKINIAVLKITLLGTIRPAVIFLDDVLIELINGINLDSPPKAYNSQSVYKAATRVLEKLDYTHIQFTTFNFVRQFDSKLNKYFLVHKDAKPIQLTKLLILKFGLHHVFEDFITQDIYEWLHKFLSAQFVRDDAVRNYVAEHSGKILNESEMETIMNAFGHESFRTIYNVDKNLHFGFDRVIIYRRIDSNIRIIPNYLMKQQ